MLTDSISKALITTAAGLVIAIPTLCVYHWLRQRIHKHAMRLESDLQSFVNELYLEVLVRFENGPGFCYFSMLICPPTP